MSSAPRGVFRTNYPAATAQQDRSIEEAVRRLREGGVIAIPTDTVYGLAASLDHPEAVDRIFEMKGRPTDKALPVLVDSPARLDEFGRSLTGIARRLVERFWPGALTIVVEASPAVPERVRRNGSTVGLRMPDNGITLAVIAAVGGGLAVTSANRSGQVEARSAAEVRDQFGDLLDAIVDGGRTSDPAPSTVVDATGPVVTVLRVGALAPERIVDALREFEREG